MPTCILVWILLWMSWYIVLDNGDKFFLAAGVIEDSTAVVALPEDTNMSSKFVLSGI